MRTFLCWFFPGLLALDAAMVMFNAIGGNWTLVAVWGVAGLVVWSLISSELS